ncbi:MAG: DUF2891 domain-containing protein [Acidobacteriota bacterium]|nr:DUF2891 domain-containing protein [Acidobacteriota bacterium]
MRKLACCLGCALALAVPAWAQTPSAAASTVPSAAAASASPAVPVFTATATLRFANLALGCVNKEYPNKLSHTLQSDADARLPRELTPSFYGCYDWHSSVHGHWLLVRLLEQYPNSPFEPQARLALGRDLTAAKLQAEAAYLERSDRTGFERPYGLAWLLQLAAELREWHDPQAMVLMSNLRPLELAAVSRLKPWLAKLPYPVRVGEHSQTAFSLGLMMDYAQTAGDHEFAELLRSKARQFYLHDRSCPMNYEPSGEDFLSPCLAEADVMRRVLPPAEFAAWLTDFLPEIPEDGSASWLPPVVSPDPGDPKLAHLDGLNLSRAWMLKGIARGLPAGDARRTAIEAAATAHAKAGLAAVTGEHYEGGHWLGSFAVYLITQRGY